MRTILVTLCLFICSTLGAQNGMLVEIEKAKAHRKSKASS